MKQSILFYSLLLASLLAYSQPQFAKAYPDTLNKKRLATSIGIQSGSYVGGLSFLAYIWYKDHDRVPFHLYDDSKGYLQMDKMGHAFSAYRESYTAYYALRWAGVKKKKALLYGGPIGLFFQTPIEIFDGLYEGWGFSWSDMIANTWGSAFFMAQEALFDEQVFLMKFSYSPSIYPDYHSHLGESHLERFFLDYNGHSYWYSGNIKRITGIQKVPQWLNVAFGYSANGMIYEHYNPKYHKGKPIPHFERYRQYMFSLDVDFTKIPAKRKWVRTIFKAINLIKVPFPALEINSEDGLKFRPLYF